MSTPAAPASGVGPARSVALLGTTAVLFAVGLIAQWWGLADFPSNAPVEQIYAILIELDIVAGFLVATTGAIIASQRRVPLKGSSVTTIVGPVLVAVALGLWIGFSGVGIALRVPTGERGRYMYDVLGTLLGGIPWIVGTMMSAYGYRRRGSRGNAIRGLLGTIVGLLLLAVTVTSAVIYGLGLTD
ncbi:MAG TPA: hypothetical protein VGM70_06605 [Pseudolysinimonas sp.]